MPESAEPDKEVEAILSDLDTILSGINGSAPPAPSAPKVDAVLSDLGTLFNGTPPPAPVPKAPAPAPAPVVLPKLAPEPPRAAPPPPPMAIELPPASKPAEPPRPLELPPEPVMEIQIVTPAAAPRPAAPPKPVEPPPPPPPPEPALEVKVVTPAPVKPVEAAKTEPPKAVEPPKPAEPPRPAAPPAAAFAVAPPEIPDKTPPEQLRKVAFFFAAPHEKKMREFISFLDGVALKVSKKPMYVERALVLPVAQGDDPKRLIDRAKESGAKGAIALVDSLPDLWIRELDEAAGEQSFFFRLIAPADVAKRSAAVDLLVDLMLL